MKIDHSQHHHRDHRDFEWATYGQKMHVSTRYFNSPVHDYAYHIGRKIKQLLPFAREPIIAVATPGFSLWDMRLSFSETFLRKALEGTGKFMFQPSELKWSFFALVSSDKVYPLNLMPQPYRSHLQRGKEDNRKIQHKIISYLYLIPHALEHSLNLTTSKKRSRELLFHGNYDSELTWTILQIHLITLHSIMQDEPF